AVERRAEAPASTRIAKKGERRIRHLPPMTAPRQEHQREAAKGAHVPVRVIGREEEQGTPRESASREKFIPHRAPSPPPAPVAHDLSSVRDEVVDELE